MTLVIKRAALLLFFVGVASCAKPQGHNGQLPEFFKSHPACISAGNDGVRMWRCDTDPRYRLGLSYSAIEYEEEPYRKNLRVLKMRGDEPTLVLDARTRLRCKPQYEETYVLSRDNAGGEKHIPAMCDGKRYEFVWHMSGEFDRYIGLIAL